VCRQTPLITTHSSDNWLAFPISIGHLQYHDKPTINALHLGAVHLIGGGIEYVLSSKDRDDRLFQPFVARRERSKTDSHGQGSKME
jgi:hypothetical protein